MKYEFKIDTRVNARTLKAVENYMAANNRNKSDALRILVDKALELENQFEKLKK